MFHKRLLRWFNVLGLGPLRQEIILTIGATILIRSTVGHRIFEEITMSWRCRRSPLKGRCIPRIIAGDFFTKFPRGEEINDEKHLKERHRPSTHRHHDIKVDVLHHSVAKDIDAVGGFGQVGIATIIPSTVKARHSLHEHREEDDVHADQARPKVKVIESFTHETTRNLWIPMVHPCEKSKQDSWCYHVVEMPDDVVGVM